MSKRLFLKTFLMTIISLPVVAFADDTETPSENTTSNYVETGALCDVNTLGVAEGAKTLYAVWEAKSYNCPAGRYLNAVLDANHTDLSCDVCPDDAYCPGFSGVYDGNESAHGLTVCPIGYNGNYEMHACTKRIDCSEVNPVVGVIEHATMETIYANVKTDCTEELDIVSPYTFDDSVCSLSCEITKLKCEYGYKANADNTVCERNFVVCEAGTYLPQGKTECEVCLEDSFCVGGQYTFREVADVEGKSNDQGIQKCDGGLKAPKGATSIADCGKLLHVDGDALYLYPEEGNSGRKGNNPRLVVQDADGSLWYANATPVSDGGPRKVSEGAQKELHIMVDGKEYTVHTTVSEGQQ